MLRRGESNGCGLDRNSLLCKEIAQDRSAQSRHILTHLRSWPVFGKIEVAAAATLFFTSHQQDYAMKGDFRARSGPYSHGVLPTSVI